MAKKYNREVNVYDAAMERIRYIFENYDNIVVSCSGGKDSTVVAYLAMEVAKEKKKPFYLFFLDQEIEYGNTIDFIDYLMKQEYVIPLWFQVSALLTNTSSISQHTVDPWNPDKKIDWVHPQKRKSIHEITWPVDVPYQFKEEKKFGFYGLVQCMEQMFNKTESVAQLIGLRADESLDRFRAVTKNPGIKGVPWCTKTKTHIKFYPIYDWRYSDIFVYFAKNNLKYNKIYDLFYVKGYKPNDMRLSNLLHEKAYECLADLQEFEPKLFDRMLNRCAGISTAQEYAGRGGSIYKVDKLPKGFETWTEYRNHLLETLPNREHAETFRKRFEKQYQNDYVIKQQVNRILINDVNNFKKINNYEEDPSIKIRQKWMEIL